MRKRLGSLLAVSAMVFAACGGTTTTTAPASVAPPASTAPGTSAAPSASGPAASAPSALETAMFGTNYKPPTGAKAGGTIVFGDWEGPNLDNLNYFYTSSVVSTEAYSPVFRGLLAITSDGK